MKRHCAGLGIALGLVVPGTGWAACSLTSNTQWCIDANTPDVPVVPSAGSRLGTSLATGDFDGDGNLDLVIGRPATDVFDSLIDGGNPDGDVLVLYGDGVFPRLDFRQLVTDSFFGEGETTTRELFGISLAVSDFSGDGIDDLAVGAPGVNTPPSLECPLSSGCDDAGVVVRVDGNAGRDLQVNESVNYLSDDQCGIPPGDDALYGSALGVGIGGVIYVGAPGQGANLDDDSGYVARVSIPFTFAQTCDDVYKPSLAGEPNRTARLGATIATIRHRNGANSSRAVVAYGAPFADFGSFDKTGLVAVSYDDGSPDSVYTQSVQWPPAGNADDDHFGGAVVAGDFDGDGDDDLVLAAPDKDTADGINVGRLYVLRNDPGILTPTSIFEHKNLGANSSEAGDQFGFALAAGYIDEDKYQDLVVGIPGEECCANDGNEGFVAVMFGSSTGLTTTGFRQFRQSDIGGTITVNGRFGASLATGDFNRDGLDDIVVGAPDHPVNGDGGVGKVFIARLDGYTGGQDLALTFTGATNGAGNPLPRPFAGQDTATVTLQAGPVEHVDSPTVTLTYPLGVSVSKGSSNAWTCSPSTLSASNPSRTIKCRYHGRLLQGEGASLPISWLLPELSTLPEVTRQAHAESLIDDLAPANNGKSLSAAVTLAALVFENGFE